MLNKKQTYDIAFTLDERLPFSQACFVAFQHVLAVLIPIVAPIVVICNALHFDIQTTSYIVSMNLIFSGIGTFIQAKRIRNIGSGLLSVQGTSSAFIIPLIIAGREGGLPLIFGLCFLGALFQVAASFLLRFTRKIFPPLVVGILVTIIGISLIKISIFDCLNEGNFVSNPTKNLLLAFIVVFTIAVSYVAKNKYFRACSIIIAIGIGYLMSFLLGISDYHQLHNTLNGVPIFNFPMIFRFGFNLRFTHLIPIILIYLLTVIESIGDLTATSLISQEPIVGKIYSNRIFGGVLGSGINSIFVSIFGGFPLTTFAQNNGIIQITGVASRYIGVFIAVILILCGLFPALSAFLSLMPKPVLGGVTLVMFGTIAAYGIKIISLGEINQRELIIMALSFGLGFSLTFYPEILNYFPRSIQEIFSSSITIGGMTAVLLNLILPK
ncbi:TPA: xanthine permease XanP [Candidatus Dependentiae bacterium]|nr:xanthine permease XanP [Candidatus Dependentiae bacterium]